MNDTLREQMSAFDPVSVSDIDSVSRHPIFGELFDDIVAAPAGPTEAAAGATWDAAELVPIAGRRVQQPGRHAVQRARRQRRTVVGTLAAAAAAVLLVTALVATRLDHGDGGGTRAGGTQTHVVTAPAWRLMGDVMPASWEPVSTHGYESGVTLTCPSATSCYVEDDPPGRQMGVEVTHDGGATWRRSRLPGGVVLSGTAPDCTDENTCFMAGQDAGGDGVIVTTDDGGRTWATLPAPYDLPAPFQFTDVSCTTASSCVAVGSSGSGLTGASFASVTADGGQHWSESELAAGFVPTAVRCFAGGGCLTVGFAYQGTGEQSPTTGALFSEDGGSTWAPATISSGVGGLSSISCGDAGECVATGSAIRTVLVTTDGGKTWARVAASRVPSSLLISISCATSSHCWASGIRYLFEDGGEGRLAGTRPLLMSTDDRGQSWQEAAVPGGIAKAVVAVSCPDRSACFALGFEPQSRQLVLLAQGT